MNKRIFLKKLIELSKMSFDMDEVPVGALIIFNNKIIGVGINDREHNNIISGHAEINAINNACKVVDDWRLDNCEMYVTLKPCMMCTGAIVDSRIKRVFYLCDRTNVCFDRCSQIDFIKINDNYYEKKYINLLKKFFKNKRN